MACTSYPGHFDYSLKQQLEFWTGNNSRYVDVFMRVTKLWLCKQLPDT
jgi:hypothetical protein